MIQKGKTYFKTKFPYRFTEYSVLCKFHFVTIVKVFYPKFVWICGGLFYVVLSFYYIQVTAGIGGTGLTNRKIIVRVEP